MTERPEPERREPGHSEPAHPGTPPPTPPPAGQPYGPGPWAAQPQGTGPAGHPHGYEPAGHGAGFRYGGRWQRLIAAIIDGLLVYVIIWVVTTPVLGFDTLYEGSLARQVLANLIAAAVAFGYYAVQHGRWGQTPGKRAMSLRVVRADDGGAISYGQAVWRLLFAYLLSLVTCGVGGLVDVAWILWDGRRQALHDKVARTVVVRTEPGMPDPYGDGRRGDPPIWH